MSSAGGWVCGAQDERPGKVVPSRRRREPPQPQLSRGIPLSFPRLRSTAGVISLPSGGTAPPRPQARASGQATEHGTDGSGGGGGTGAEGEPHPPVLEKAVSR